MEEKSKNNANKLKKIQKSLENLKHTVSSSNQKLSNYAVTTEKFKSDIDRLNKELETEEARLNDIRSSLTEKTSEFTKEIQLLQKSLDPWDSKLKEKENEKLAESR